MEKKYILISMEDEKAKGLADVLGNKTCKKIIDYLAETKESSEKDISDALNIPLNTAEYNLKKLIKAGFIEQTKNFFWSKKGKKISLYKLSNKSILISPVSKSKFKSILPAALISLAGAIIIKTFYVAKTPIIQDTLASEEFAGVAKAVETGSSIIYSGNLWLWFLMGAVFAITIFVILNWKKL